MCASPWIASPPRSATSVPQVACTAQGPATDHVPKLQSLPAETARHWPARGAGRHARTASYADPRVRAGTWTRPRGDSYAQISLCRRRPHALRHRRLRHPGNAAGRRNGRPRLLYERDRVRTGPKLAWDWGAASSAMLVVVPAQPGNQQAESDWCTADGAVAKCPRLGQPTAAREWRSLMDVAGHPRAGRVGRAGSQLAWVGSALRSAQPTRVTPRPSRPGGRGRPGTSPAPRRG